MPPAHGVHSALRLALANEPGLHAVGRAAPPAHAKPASHSKQSGSPSISLALANVPASHVGANLSDAPSGQKSPASHASHAVAFDAAWYDPAEHSKHRPSSCVGVWLPGEHGDGAVEPVEQLEPGGQTVHCSDAERSVALEKRPTRHGRGEDVPRGQ